MIAGYARWLHTGWPSGTIEKLPRVDSQARTNLPGVFIVGDLTGVPLLKFALDSGARAARTIAAELETGRGAASSETAPLVDVVVVGAGVSGIAAAIEARRLGLSCEVLEGNQPFSTLVHFPVRKPIFTYPSDFVPEGALQVTADIKEDLVAELRAQAGRAGIVPRHARAQRL